MRRVEPSGAMGSNAGDEPRLDLVVSGHINLDHILKVARFPAVDRTVPVLREETRLGGTGANIALAATREGLRVGLVSLVGEEFPLDLEDRIRHAGVETRGVRRVARTTTTTCHIVEDELGRQFTLLHGGPMDEQRRPGPEAALVGETPWLHLTTGNPDYQLALKSIAQRKGVHVAVDPAQEIPYRWDRSRLERLLEGAEILFGNSAEVRDVASIFGLGNLRGLLGRVPLVVITEGRSGARAYSRRGSERVGSVPVRVASQRVGAGDAFRGGFYGAWLRGAKLRACLRAGTVAARGWLLEGAPVR